MSDPNKQANIPNAEQIAALDPAALEALTALCLQQYPAGFQPRKVFAETARISVLSTVEVIPLMQDEKDGRTKVLLTNRPESNDWWCGMLHVPGNAALATDEKDSAYSYKAPIDRLVRKELGGAVEIVGRPHILRGRFAGDTAVRGRESTLIHWAEVKPVEGVSLPDKAKFYDVEEVLNNPPKDFIAAHDTQVLDAWASFEEFKVTGRFSGAEQTLAEFRGQ
jgi:hypothetical protein